MKYTLEILCSKCGNSNLERVFPIEQTLKAFNNITGTVMGCPACDTVTYVESFDRSQNQYLKVKQLDWGYKKGKKQHEKDLKRLGINSYNHVKSNDENLHGITLSDPHIKHFYINGATTLNDNNPSYCSLGLFIGDEGNTMYRVSIPEKELTAICKKVEENKYIMFKEEYTK